MNVLEIDCFPSINCLFLIKKITSIVYYIRVYNIEKSGNIPEKRQLHDVRMIIINHNLLPFFVKNKYIYLLGHCQFRKST